MFCNYGYAWAPENTFYGKKKEVCRFVAGKM